MHRSIAALLSISTLSLVLLSNTANAGEVYQNYSNPTVYGYIIGTVYPAYGSSPADTARRFCQDKGYERASYFSTGYRSTAFSYINGSNGVGTWSVTSGSSITTIDFLICSYTTSTPDPGAGGIDYPNPTVNNYGIGTTYPAYGSSASQTADRFCRDRGYARSVYYTTSIRSTAYSYINGTGGNGNWSITGGANITMLDLIRCEASASASAGLTAGSNHSCALTSTGGAKCWGSNAYGQIGDGTATHRTTPVDVAGLTSGVSALSGGYYHTCALVGGGVRCWGLNLYGELGDGTTTSRSTPVSVIGLSSGVASISTNYENTCAVTTTGGAKCWGHNAYGQLGDGTTTHRATPVDVVGLATGVRAVGAGGGFGCALTSAGGVKCWGYNGSGQLGDGTTVQRLTPVDVVGLTSGVIAISTGDSFACALTSNGGVKCWGANFFGELGDGTTSQRLSPVDVVGLASGVSAIATGNGATCALTTGGGVKCWGYNAYGNLGDGTTTNRTTPTNVVGLTSGVTAIGESNGAHICARMSGTGVKCWGYNAYGELGNGSTSSTLTPVSVVGF